MTPTSPNSPVKFVLFTSNTKLGKAACTYVTQQSCPKTCPHLDNGCYGESGNVGIHTKQLNNTDIQFSPEQLATLEVNAIAKGSWGRGHPGNLPRPHPLRLHVVGDVGSNKAAKILAAGTRYWRDLVGPVWTYTHNWKKIQRKHFQHISTLASCEKLSDILLAQDRGYATALIVPEHDSPQAQRTLIPYPNNQGARSVNLIPCPSQTKGIPCSQCQLCMKDDFLKATNSVITFAAHGSGKHKVQQTLVRLAGTTYA